MNKFKLGLDLDGVITHHPDYIRWFADKVLASGQEVIIITGRREFERGITLKQLKDLQIRFSCLIMYPHDYVFEKGIIEMVDLKAIGEWKALKCAELGISVMLEDSMHWYHGVDFPCPTVHI